jgi:uncharacterized membrane protein
MVWGMIAYAVFKASQNAISREIIGWVIIIMVAAYSWQKLKERDEEKERATS